MENVKTLLKAIVELTESSFEVWKDGKFDGLKDIMEYVDDVPEVKAVFDNWPAIKEELPLLASHEGRQEAIEYLELEFDIDNENAEALIESLIGELESLITSAFTIFSTIKEAIIAKKDA